jgi:hypothetical protein
MKAHRRPVPLTDQVHRSKQQTYWSAFPIPTIRGTRIVKVEPRPSSLSTVMSPPIIWQNPLLIARPRPVAAVFPAGRCIGLRELLKKLSLLLLRHADAGPAMLATDSPSYFTFWSSQFAITSAIAALFCSSIIMCPLPCRPAFSNRRCVFRTPAWVRNFDVQ